MGKFSKIFHHIETKDLRNKYEQKKAAKIEEEKKKEDTKKYVASAMENVKYNWRSKIDVGEIIREGMTTSDVATISTPANPDEVLNDTPLDNADDFAPGARGDVADYYDATVGTSIKSGGSGSGNNGGFDIGNHLAFDGDGSTDGARWMITKPVDTTNMDHIVMSIITGDGSNGGETPDDAFEGLRLYYKTPEMNDFIPINYFPTLTGSDYRGGDIGYPDEDKLFNTVDGPTFVDSIIIPVGGGSPTLQDYNKYIPSYARGKDTQFLLYQFQSSGTGKDNYGVKNISYRRKYPIQVVAPLDNPEASSFIRGAEQGSTPKKRKKDVDDKLAASDEYTTFKFGNEFPGQEVRVGGEDPFKSAKIGDDVEPSPQGKDEVKKTFGDFNNQTKTVRGAPTAEPEAEPVEDPEVIATTQSKTATNDDGEPIEPEPVAAGAVQGADATNLDQDEPTEPEPTEPEPTSPDQEEVEQELETEPDVEDKSEEELNQQLDNKLNALDKALAFGVESNLLGFKKLAKVAKFAVQGILSIVTIADRLNPFKKQDTETNAIQGGLSVFLNSMDIAISVMDGEIKKSNPTAAQINTYKKSILPSLFKGDTANLIPISDIRHEYADGNIYVERINGKAVVRDNTGGIRQDLTNKDKIGSVGGKYAGFSQVGGGYSQFIIPKDGGEPYVHYYDYNYENLNNTGDVSPAGLFGMELTRSNFAGALMKSVSNIIHQLRPGNTKLNIPARARTSMLGYFTNFNDVLDGLKTTSTLEGWPPGIHGAALTDITIPLSQLPKETQEMIAAHPLSWTPERMANMSAEEIEEQLYSVMQTEADFDDYFQYTADITRMTTEPVNTVPYAVAMQEMDELYSEFEPYDIEFNENLEKGYNESPFTEAERAVYEDMQTLTAQRDKDVDENAKKLGPGAQSDLWDEMVGPLYNSVKKTLDSGGTVSKARMDKLSRQHAKYKKQADKMDDDYYRIQNEINEKYYEQYDKLSEYYNAQAVSRSVEGYEGYPTTVDEKGREDYTTLDGRVIISRFNQIKTHVDVANQVYAQLEAMYEPVADLEKYVQGNYVREAKIKEFGEKHKGISADNWSPKNKGGKPKPKSKPDPRASFAGTGSDAATFSFDGSTNKNKKKKQNEEVLLKYARPVPERKELFERVKSKGFFNPDDIKPEFPENPPPKLDPKTGMHPQYGKKANRYKKLDPHSANSMPLTGDPETDEVVRKQKTINKIKKMAKKNLKESDFTNITTGNKVGQTFQHTSGATITLDGALGGKMMVPSQVTLDLGFGEKITVDGPTESDFGFTGFTKPLDLKVQKRIAGQSKDEINDKLDASEKASGAETAKVEGEGDIWTWTEYMNQMNDLSDKYAKMAEPLEKIKLDYINKNEDVPIGIVDKIDAITKALHQAQEALHQKWLAYNKVPDLPTGGSETSAFDGYTPETLPIGGISEKPPTGFEYIHQMRNLENIGKKHAPILNVFNNAPRSVRAPLKLFAGYLTNTIKGNAAQVLDQKDINSAWENTYIDVDNNSLSVDGYMQNVFGGESLSQLSLDKNTAKLKFGFKPHINAKEFAQHPDQYNFLQKQVINFLGPYVADLQVGPGILKPIGGVIASKATEISKMLGGGKNLEGEITMSMSKLKKLNPDVYNYLIKKKKVNESTVFSKIKKFRNKY